MDEVKRLLSRHGYRITATLKDGGVVLQIPDRVQEPLMQAYSVKYGIGIDSLSFHQDGDEWPSGFECPQYACRCFILLDIKRHCEALNFDTNLIEFFDGFDKIDETEFFTRMWPKDIEYSDDIRRKEYNLKDLLIRVQNAAVPFHHDFYFEAEQLGVLPGYIAIRSTFVFGEDE
jgi:hypothetical protein